MQFIINPIEVEAGKFTYKIESVEQYARTDEGMANGSPAVGFFQTKEAAIGDARKSLEKAGVKDEDIIVQ